jgi:DNA-binding Lrp family transcriptional regulator
MDAVDREILNIIQSDFPISPEPYAEIGRKVGVSGDEALDRVRRLVREGVVRKVGPFFDAAMMGHKSTLCSVQVPDEKVSLLADIIAGYPEITHNYLREGVPNLWFTIIAPTEARITQILDDISKKSGVGPIYNLPAKRMFKVKVDLRIEGE